MTHYKILTFLLIALTPFLNFASHQPQSQMESPLNNKSVLASELKELPPPPIPAEFRNVSFISRWVISGTFFTDFIPTYQQLTLRAGLEKAWDREIDSIINSTTFKSYLNETDLQELALLLFEYKALGQAYITIVLDTKNASNLLNEWSAKGEEIAHFFYAHQFDPNKELPRWFFKATNAIAAAASAFASNDLATFFASYGSTVRNFEEIGFTLSPTPCQ